MKTLTLKRVSTNFDGTYGVLIDDTVPFAVTLEKPWKDNERQVSCIPARTYTCQRTISPRFGETFEMMNVPGRTSILFHKGNVEDDTSGCILVAEQFERLGSKTAILKSAKGFEELVTRLLGIENFILTVVWV